MTASVRLTIADGMSELDPLAVAIVTETTDRTSIHVAAARPADVDMRAEFRVWGSWPRAMAAMTGKGPERHAGSTGRVLCTGNMHRAEIRNGDPEAWNGGGHRGIVWASNDGEWIDEPIDDAYMLWNGGARSGRPERIARHKVRVYVSDHGRGFYSWRCSCGKQGAPDILHREYARDAWREAHGLSPVVNRPLV